MKKGLIAGILCASVTATNVSAARLGVCSHIYYDRNKMVNALESIKTDWNRDEISWDVIQSEKDGEFSVPEKYMNYIKNVDAAGVNQLLILDYGVTFYDGIENRFTVPTESNKDYYNGYLEYVRYMVNKVKDYVDAYEVWNEVNLSSFNYNSLASGEDYAKLYLDVKKIVNDLDPTARVLCGCVAGYSDSAFNYAKDIFKYIKTQGNVNDLVDVFSIHMYPQLDYEAYADGLSSWENVFDTYGYTGEVWMTENGVTASGTDGRTEDAQAAIVPKLGVQWENYLKSNNRSGVNFWYDLRNDITSNDYEDNFGLFDEDFKKKPAGYAVEHYNHLTGNKSLESMTKIKTKNHIILADEYGYVACYSGKSGKVYIVYDTNENSQTTDIPLSGDYVRIYDHLGNLTEEITNPSGTKTVTMANEPVYIECRVNSAEIERIEFNKEKRVATVLGECNHGSSIVIEAEQDGKIISTTKAKVKDGKFVSKEISVIDDGEVTFYAGRGSSTAYGAKTLTLESEESRVAKIYDTVLAVNGNSVRISGKLTTDDDICTIAVVPENTNLDDIKSENIAYAGIAAVKDFSFTHEFTMPDIYGGKYKILLGSISQAEAAQSTFSVGTEEKYMRVCDLELAGEDTFSLTAELNNVKADRDSAKILLAQYADDNRLLKINIEEIALDGGVVTPQRMGISDKKENGTKMIKGFVFGGEENMLPLCEYEVMTK